MDTRLTYQYEYTDTFGGERNYCWVKRGEVVAKDAKHAMRLARNQLGLTSVKGDYSDVGYYAEWKPRGCCTILTVSVD